MEEPKNVPSFDDSDRTPLSYHLDDSTKLYLNDGKFYKMVRHVSDEGKEEWNSTLLFSIPLIISGLIKQSDKWRIKYTFDGNDRTDTIDATLQHIGEKVKNDRKTTSFFAQFLYKFKTDFEKRELFTVLEEPITINDKGIISVNKGTEQDIRHILSVISEIYKISTHPNAFLTSFCYGLVAPYSYEIRLEGQKFPYRLTDGKTHGGKTSNEEFFILRGYDQDIRDRKETMETMKTIITFGQQVEKSRLPFVLDDVSNKWLEVHKEGLKGGTDGVKFVARGTRSLEQIVYQMYGMPVMTMNAEPNIPIALSDRMIIHHFREKESKRQNKSEFERLKNTLKPGFMYNLQKEMFSGRNVQEIIENVHYKVQRDEEINQTLINYTHDKLYKLFLRHNIVFPSEPPQGDAAEHSLIDDFLTYVVMRIFSADRDGTVLKKFSHNIKKKEYNVTSEGYNDFLKDHKWVDFNVTDFVNELKSERITYDHRWVPSLGKSVRCIIIPEDMLTDTDPDKEKLIL